jgi:hypothetical protein
LLEDEEVYELSQTLALKLFWHARFDHARLPCRRRLITVDEPRAELRVDAERADYEIVFRAFAFVRANRRTMFERGGHVNIVHVLRDVMRAEFERLIE